MHPESPHPPLDLLVVGGLTIDRFADGRVEPGGSVLHIARALVPRGLRVGIGTVAGPEPIARAGLDELRRLAPDVTCAVAEATIAFRHEESAAGRSLWLEQRGGHVALASRDAAAVLLAPVAAEVAPPAPWALPSGQRRGAILQGWLRSTGEGGEVEALPLAALGAALVEALASFDLVIASREDLRGEAAHALDQVDALRRVLGERPFLVVTDGVAGLWVDTAGERWHLPIPHRVADVSTVGAGDVLAAHLLTGEWHRPVSRPFATAKATAAMRAVAEVLAARRHP